MAQPPNDPVRAAWSNQPDLGGNVDLERARAAVHKREAEVRRRDRIAYACAAIIAPSWAAAMWFIPDLRVAAAVGLVVAVWIAVQIYSRSAARLTVASVDQACVAYQRALLQRERELCLAMPRWYFVPSCATRSRFSSSSTSPRLPRTALPAP